MLKSFLTTLNFINLTTGNDTRINDGISLIYRKRLTIIISTFYAAVFTIGLLFGTFIKSGFWGWESTIGFAATVLTYILGFSILHTNWRKPKSIFLIPLTIILVTTQTALIFNLFPIPITNILYYLANVLTLIFIQGLTYIDNE